MNIEVQQNGQDVTLKVEGIVKSIMDSQNLQDTINSFSKELAITMLIEDSYSLPSSTIGFILKKIKRDQFNIQTKIGSDRLWDLLENLSLVKALNASRI